MKPNDQINLKPATLEEAKTAIREYIAVLGLRFHPDINFLDYRRKTDDGLVFTPRAAVNNNVVTHTCRMIFERAGEDMYSYAIHHLEPILCQIQNAKQ